MTGADIDPAQRALILVMRAEELIASGGPESLEEAVLALEGAQDAAGADGVDQGMRDDIERRLGDARARRDGTAPDDEEDEDGGDDGAAEETAGEGAADESDSAAG